MTGLQVFMSNLVRMRSAVRNVKCVKIRTNNIQAEETFDGVHFANSETFAEFSGEIVEGF